MASSISSATIMLLFAVALLCLLTTPVSAADRLNASQSLGLGKSGQSLEQGAYLFIIQKDCNLVLYDNNKPVWASGTSGRGSYCHFSMQRDGNLVIYNGDRYIWASKTNGQNGNYYLILQRDRNVVIYKNCNKAIWATRTNVDNAAIAIIPHSNGTAATSGAAQNKVNELYP